MTFLNNIRAAMDRLRARRKTLRFEDKYVIEEEHLLGKGAFGEVYRCRCITEPHSVYAVKVITTRNMSSLDQKEVENEIQIMEALIGSEHCVRLYDSFVEENQIFLVLEYLKGGELLDRIVKKQGYSESDVAATIKSIALGLQVLHDDGIVHRDLKPGNLLLVSETDDTTVKLADYGFAAYCHDLLEDGCGTLPFEAPEVLRNEKYATAPDMWSLGVITYIMLCGSPPFSGDDEMEMIQEILTGRYTMEDKDGWGEISEEAKDFVRNLLQRNISSRMSVHEVLNHEWIEKVDNNTISRAPLVAARRALLTYLAKEKMKKAIMAMHAVRDLQMILPPSS